MRVRFSELISALMIMFVMIIGLGMAGCDFNEGPVEKTGESIDEAIDDVGDSVEDAGDAIEDSTS